MADTTYITYPLVGGYMDASVPPSRVKPGAFGYLSGMDGRYTGGLRSFPGMHYEAQFSMLGPAQKIPTRDMSNGGVRLFQHIYIQHNADTAFDGFVVLLQQEVTPVPVWILWWVYRRIHFGDTGGWTATPLYTVPAANIDGVDCVSDRNRFYIVIDGYAALTAYCTSPLSNPPAWTTIGMGAGVYSDAGPSPEHLGNEVDADEAHYLGGMGTFQIAWRLSSKARGIVGALSDPVTISLDHRSSSRATGAVYVNTVSGEHGLFVDGDQVHIGSDTYEMDTDDDVETGAILVDIDGVTDVVEQLRRLAAAINLNLDGDVTAVPGQFTVTLTARRPGPDGNTVTLGVTEEVTTDETRDLTVSGDSMSGGGAVVDIPEKYCKITLALPEWSDIQTQYGENYATMAARFDTIEVFRTIDLGQQALFAQMAGYFYKEQEITLPQTSGAWDALEIEVGKLFDQSLLFQTPYNPTTDVVKPVPHGRAIGRYEGLTFVTHPSSQDGGLGISHSSLRHDSGEYFSTFNERRGAQHEGPPLRFINAGDMLVVICANSILQTYRAAEGYPLLYTRHHLGRGGVGPTAAHAVGNNVFVVTPGGLMVLHSGSMEMMNVSSVARIFQDRWAGTLHAVQSGYDSRMDASYFLNPLHGEMLQLNHTTQAVCLIENTPYVAMTEAHSLDTYTGQVQSRVYFLTSTQLHLCSIDADRQTGASSMIGYGESLDLIVEQYDQAAGLMAFTTSPASLSTIAGIRGARVYVTSGPYAGQWASITTASTRSVILTTPLTWTSIPSGTTVSIAPVVCRLRLPSIRYIPAGLERRSLSALPELARITLTSMAVKAVRVPAGGTGGVWRVGAYRNSQNEISGSQGTITLTLNPADSVCALRIDGIDVEPYLEYISTQADFELTVIDAGVILPVSRNVKP